MRARNLKPGFFKSEQLLKCEPLARILFEGLWCMADRNGYLEDRPFQIKIEVLPCDNCDVDLLLEQLRAQDLIIRYDVSGERYLFIPKFLEHQAPHIKEKPRAIPAYKSHEIDVSTRPAPDQHQTSTNLGDVRHPLNPESLLLNPESTAAQSCAHARGSDFQKIFDAGCAVNPALTSKSTAVIHQWIADGVTPEDAVPEVQRLAKQARGWKFFTGAVLDARATRLTPLPNGKARVSTQEAGVADTLARMQRIVDAEKQCN